MALPASRLQEIEDVARQWRENAMLAADGLHFEAPSTFDLVSVVLGPVQVVPNLTRNGQRLAGLLDTRTAVATVSCEEYDPPPRQSFSAAHELGHFALHEQDLTGWQPACVQLIVDREDDDEGPDATQREAEADAFAGAFLVPASELRVAIEKFGWCAGFLAERFGVSNAAMRRRYRDLASLDQT